LTRSEWIVKATEVHGNKYDYSGVSYVNSKIKIKIRCLTCGIVFEQSPDDHASGRGCRQCGIKKRSDDKRDTRETWIAKARAVHGVQYDYSAVEYVNSQDKVKIRCLTCGLVFEQKATNHVVQKQGCPKCKESRGERVVSMVLDSLLVSYERQKKFDGCKYKSKLPFDFYLPDHNTCIEYHGRQHYEPVDHFGGDKGLKTRQRLDRIKAKYCKDNGITLEVIPYWFDEEQVRAIVSRIAHIQLSLL